MQLVPDSVEIERSYQCFCALPKWRARDREPADLGHRLIIALAAEHKLRAVYYRRYYVERGGLVSYQPNFRCKRRPSMSW